MCGGVSDDVAIVCPWNEPDLDVVKGHCMTTPLTRYREYSEKLISGDLVERVRGEGEKVIHRYCIFEKDFHFSHAERTLTSERPYIISYYA